MMPKLKKVMTFALLVGMVGAAAALIYSGAWADEKLEKKASPAPAEARNGDKLITLHKQQQALAKGQFESWKGQALQALKDFAPLSDASPSPFSSGSTPGITPQQAQESQRLKKRIDQVRVADAQAHLYQWAHRLLAVEMELNKADRAAVYSAHLLRMKNLEDEFKKAVEPPSKEFVQKHTEEIKVFAAEAEFHRLEAEILLEREREKP